MNETGILPEAFAGWHQVQESLSRMTGLEIAVYGSNGKPLGLVSGESPFCRAMRRSGHDGSFCDEQCGQRIGEALGSKDVLFFKCRSGQLVFAFALENGSGGGLVVAGGKVFGNKKDYETALGMLKREGGKVSITGRHRYRFIGKNRLAGVVELLKNAASQHFGTSFEKYKYQLRLHRQSALLENISLLYHEKEQADLVNTLLRSMSVLFEAETASLLLYGANGAKGDEHYAHGKNADEVSRAGEAFGVLMRAVHKTPGEIYKTRNKNELADAGLPEGAVSLVSVPLINEGVQKGALNLYNAEPGQEDMPVLRAYVQQAAAIMDNKGLRRSVEEKMRNLRRLVGANAQMGSLMDPDEIFRFIFEKSAEMLQAERGSLMLLNERTEELIVKVAKGMDEELRGQLRLKSGKGIAGGVATTGAPLMVQDMESDSRLLMKKRPRYKTKSFMSLPLKAEGRVIGVINLSDKMNGEVFNQGDLELLSGFASQAGVALERAIFYNRALELKKVSITDALTGLLDRRYFNERVMEEMDRSKRYKHHFSLMLMDIDDFSFYNETNGRKAGDDALRKMSSVLKATLRANDILARYGDEEFALILPETSQEKAKRLAERIRRRVEAARFPASAPVKFNRLTLSVGLAGYPEDGLDLPALFGNVYKALTRAKELGKNRVETFRPV